MVEFYVGKVIETEENDNHSAGRIKVSLPNKDSYTKSNNIVDAFPLLPKIFHVAPKLNEAVIVLISNKDAVGEQRWYIGPILSEPQEMYYQTMGGGATKFLAGGLGRSLQDVKNQGVAIGAMPEAEDVAILGRKNTDIILKDNDVRIRSGVRLTKPEEHKVVFNREAPSFIKLKYYESPITCNITKLAPDGKTKVQEQEDVRSVATIMADKINLITSKQFNDSFDPDELISDDYLTELFDTAKRLPYGEDLCHFLSLFLKLYFSHCHANNTANGTPIHPVEIKKQFDNEYGSTSELALQSKLLSPNLRIN